MVQIAGALSGVSTAQAAALSKRRAEYAGKTGAAGLISDARVFAIALFAALGGVLYGYNQGQFGQILTMTSFQNRIGVNNIDNLTIRGLLTGVLELGAWVGVLANGIAADSLGRKLASQVAVLIFCIGTIVQAAAQNANYIYAGRFVTGLGVGAISMLVPLYNAELSPPQLRGAMVSLQQLAICFGIMISYWIGYGTNFIGGSGANQSDAAWLIPICLQLVPAIILGVGLQFMPQSPRWLMAQDRAEECLDVLASLRRRSPSDPGVNLEYQEIQAQHLFEKETSAARFPHLQDNTFSSRFKLGVSEYTSLLTNPSLFKRVLVAVFIMVFQQWTGINAILYYAAFIFQKLGLADGTISLLASGVGGILLFLTTIPAVLYIDQIGRKPILIVGALGMAFCHFVVAGLYGAYGDSWPSHRAAGWAAVVFVWLFEANFGYSWGPGAWVVISEVFPLGVRAKGVSIGGSSNWLNNFAIGIATPQLVGKLGYGAFIFFGVITTIGAAFVYFVVPETKGRTLEEMDELFGDQAGLAREDRERMDSIYRRLGLLEDDGHLEKEKSEE